MAKQRYNANEVGLFKPYVHDTHYPDNWNHVKEHLLRCPANLWPAIMCEYVQTVNHAFDKEPRPVGRMNAAEAEGNRYIRIVADDLMRNDRQVVDRLSMIMDAGPQRECSTCAHWRRIDDYTAGCNFGNASNGVDGLCRDWESRV